MMDFLDNILGPLNYLDRLLGWLQISTRRGSRRRKQRYGRMEMVRVKIPYSDRASGVQPPANIRSHLRKYGVQTYGYTHDANHWYCDVAKNQYEWFLKLYNDGALWSPRTAWRDKR